RRGAVPGGAGSYGAALVALRRPQGAQVVRAGEEHGAEGDPQEGGQPAPDDGDRRTHDGSGAGHGSEVVPPQDVLIRGDVIHAVVHLVRRGGEVLVQRIHAPGEEVGVD